MNFRMLNWTPSCGIFRRKHRNGKVMPFDILNRQS